MKIRPATAAMKTRAAMSRAVTTRRPCCVCRLLDEPDGRDAVLARDRVIALVAGDVVVDLPGIAGKGEVGVPVLLLREPDADGEELREPDDGLRVAQADAVGPVALIDRRRDHGGPRTHRLVPLAPCLPYEARSQLSRSFCKISLCPFPPALPSAGGEDRAE